MATEHLKKSMARISKLRFETANPVLIVYNDGIVLQTDPHSLEMLIGASK
jgi:hypothetical protein